jgi:hypothetical protein
MIVLEEFLPQAPGVIADDRVQARFERFTPAIDNGTDGIFADLVRSSCESFLDYETEKMANSRSSRESATGEHISHLLSHSFSRYAARLLEQTSRRASERASLFRNGQQTRE